MPKVHEEKSAVTGFSVVKQKFQKVVTGLEHHEDFIFWWNNYFFAMIVILVYVFIYFIRLLIMSIWSNALVRQHANSIWGFLKCSRRDISISYWINVFTWYEFTGQSLRKVHVNSHFWSAVISYEQKSMEGNVLCDGCINHLRAAHATGRKAANIDMTLTYP